MHLNLFRHPGDSALIPHAVAPGPALTTPAAAA
jgi:hypothetical protein